MLDTSVGHRDTDLDASDDSNMCYCGMDMSVDENDRNWTHTVCVVA